MRGLAIDMNDEQWHMLAALQAFFNGTGVVDFFDGERGALRLYYPYRAALRTSPSLHSPRHLPDHRVAMTLSSVPSPPRTITPTPEPTQTDGIMILVGLPGKSTRPGPFPLIQHRRRIAGSVVPLAALTCNPTPQFKESVPQSAPGEQPLASKHSFLITFSNQEVPFNGFIRIIVRWVSVILRLWKESLLRLAADITAATQHLHERTPESLTSWMPNSHRPCPSIPRPGSRSWKPSGQDGPTFSRKCWGSTSGIRGN